MISFTLMKEAALYNFKESITDNMTFYQSSQNEFFLEELHARDLKMNLVLKVDSTSNKSSEDLSNAIALYEYYKQLPLSLATDEKFWSFLTHTFFWEYMCKRWPVKEAEGDEVEFIKTRFFFSAKNKNFYRNGLSRLWWYVHLTYEPNKKDHYYYTRILLGYQDLANLLIETPSLSRNKVALKAILEVISNIEALENKGEIDKVTKKRQLIRDLIKHINLVGGVTIWDTLNEKEAYVKAWEYVNPNLKYNIKQFN